MGRILYWLIQFWPFWAGSYILVCYDMGRYYRRLHSPKQWIFWISGTICGILVLPWLFFRGDRNAAIWVRGILGN